VTFPTSGARKLVLDEESFQNLLAAAYTLQENKGVLQPGGSEHDWASVLSDVAALRAQILAHSDAVESGAVNPKDAKAKPNTAAQAAALVTDCLRRLTKADGASVCLIVDGYLRPTACSGTIAKISGGSVASNSLVATERLRNGRGFQSANACSDIRLGPSLCVQLQIGSLLAFPIERQNEIAGLIEVRWTKADAFSGGDERICQLMADLMGEVLEGEDSRVNASVPALPQNTVSAAVKPPLPATNQTEDSISPLDVGGRGCRVCGKPLNDDLNFCGSCGMLSASPDNSMQGKWASMWFMQQAQKTVETEEARSERLWPLNAENSQNANARIDSLTESRSDDIETSSESKRSPRRVLAVLKSRFRARAMGQ
jgi:GAF domain-containing protein